MNADFPASQNIAALYDQLSRFIVWMNFLKFRGRIASLTIHKTLHIPPNSQKLYDKNNQAEYLNDVVFQKALPGDHPTVLDAGCGFGGTIFRWYSQKPGKYTGFSLSPYQLNIARQQAEKRRISSQCQFLLKNYEEPIDYKYQIIIAIESLVHASNLERAITNLMQALLPGGKLIVVDDMLVEDMELGDPDLILLKRCWSLSQLGTQEQYSLIFKANRLKLIDQKDYTGQVRITAENKLNRKKAVLQWLLKVIPCKDFRFIVNAYLGGFALEELYRRKKVKYILMIGQKE
jgi:SAM-dependent methyltransferase